MRHSLIFCSAGNIMMLSEGRPGVDSLYSLHEGTFTPNVLAFTVSWAAVGGG